MRQLATVEDMATLAAAVMEDVSIIEGRNRAAELSRTVYVPGAIDTDDPFSEGEHISKFNPRYFPDRPGRPVKRIRSNKEIRELLDSLRLIAHD